MPWFLLESTLILLNSDEKSLPLLTDCEDDDNEGTEYAFRWLQQIPGGGHICALCLNNIFSNMFL